MHQEGALHHFRSLDLNVSEFKTEFLENNQNYCRFISKFNLMQNHFIVDNSNVVSNLMEFEGNWPKDVKRKFLKDMGIIENFISSEEEQELLAEIEPYLKRLRYETGRHSNFLEL